MQANRKINLCYRKSPHLHVVPQQSTKMQHFLLHRTGLDFSSRNKFTNLGSFAKVSVPVESIIPWLKGLSLSVGVVTLHY